MKSARTRSLLRFAGLSASIGLCAALLSALPSALPLALPSALAAAAVPPLPAEVDPLVQNRDPNVRPGDDFFRHANGKWLANNPIPASESSWGIGRLVVDQVRGQLREICETSAASGGRKGSLEQLVGDFWMAGMDSAAIERQGIEPLRGELARIDAIKDRDELLRVVETQHRYGVHPLYGLFIGQDDKDSDSYVVFLWQGGLGLPDRDYYVLPDSSTVRIREEYPRHVAAMMRLLGQDDARALTSAQSVMAIETALAGASRTLEGLRDPYENYNKLSLRQLDELTPGIAWKKHFGAMGISAPDSVVVGQPEFLAAADSTLRNAPLEQWKDYLRWTLVNTFAQRLSRPFEQQDFRFYSEFLEGRKSPRPRWKRVLDAEEDGIGELMGQIWVRKHCSPATKARYERLVDDFFATYAERIKQLDWMTGPTKEKALAKLARVNKKVAYPDHWKDFSALELDRTSYAANQMRVNEWWFRHEAAKLGQPVDRNEWHMTPQTYNAYYSGSNVEIVLPAGVFLVPGLPDSLMDDAIVYANAGAGTIGHEITHGFDDYGRQYDAEGNLNPWWSDADSTQFTQRAQALIEQYDAYVVGGRNVRGEATLGENISDLGGVVIGYEAFKKTEQWKKGEKLNGLTPDQRFFFGYAFAWMGHQRPEYLDQMIMSDVHAPAFLRVNGAVVNVDAFYEAFDVKAGDAMYRKPEERVRIW